MMLYSCAHMATVVYQRVKTYSAIGKNIGRYNEAKREMRKKKNTDVG